MNHCPSCHLFRATVFSFLCIVLVISLFKIAPKCSVGVLHSKKAVMCLRETIHMLDQLHSGMGFSTVGREFSINESTIYMK